MSYTKKLTTFTKGNQLSNCGKYNLEDLDDMFCHTQFSNSELYLEDVLTENERGRAYQAYTLTSTVTIMEQLDDDELNMYMLLEDDDEVECSLDLDYEFQQQSE